MLPFLLFVAGVFWILLGVLRITGFRNGSEQFVEAMSKIWLIFGFIHLAVAFFLVIAPTPFGQITNLTVSSNTTFSYQLVNTTTLNFNSSGSSSGNSTIGNVFVNSSTTDRTIAYNYNVFGTEMVVFLSYAYFLILFVYLFLFAIGWLMLAFSKKREDNDDEN